MTIRALKRISHLTDASQALEAQEFRIMKWAEFARPGEPIEWYVDPSVSGRIPLRQRPDGKRLWNDLQQGDVLAVTRIDRLARNVKDLLEIIEHVEARGATFVAVDQQIDTSAAAGRFMLTMLGALAEMEAAVVGERVRAAREQFAREGRHVGKIPWGFQSVPNPHGKGKVLRPHPEQGPKLRDAVRAVINGGTKVSQAQKLGISESLFYKLMINPRLYGQDPASGGKLDPDAALISASEWQALQKTIPAAVTLPPADSFAPALLCWHCRKRLYLIQKRQQYRCGSHPSHNGKAIVARSIADPFIEEEFLRRYGDTPRFAVSVADDTERRERLAMVEVQLEDATNRWRDETDDDEQLFAEVQRLRAERRDILSEPADTTLQLQPTGQTYGEAWKSAETITDRLALLNETMHIIVYPPNRPEGRFEVVDRLAELVPADIQARYGISVEWQV